MITTKSPVISQLISICSPNTCETLRNVQSLFKYSPINWSFVAGAQQELWNSLADGRVEWAELTYCGRPGRNYSEGKERSGSEMFVHLLIYLRYFYGYYRNIGMNYRIIQRRVSWTIWNKHSKACKWNTELYTRVSNPILTQSRYRLQLTRTWPSQRRCHVFWEQHNKTKIMN